MANVWCGSKPATMNYPISRAYHAIMEQGTLSNHTDVDNLQPVLREFAKQVLAERRGMAGLQQAH